MLAIRMQRVGRKGHAMYRVVVQEARRQPTSGNVIAQLGSYDPHTKAVTLDKEKAALYLTNGAQPSDRVVKLFIEQKVQLPSWVIKPTTTKQKSIKNQEKLRRNQEPEPETEEVVEAQTESAADSIEAPETPAANAEEAEPAVSEPVEDETPASIEEPAAEAENTEDLAPAEAEETESVAEKPATKAAK